MRIQIAQRYKPFSHKPGISCLLPGVSVPLKIFPTLIQIEGGKDIPIDVRGPVKDFTVQQDLEKGIIRVWGQALSGYFLYCIVPGDPIKVVHKKSPQIQYSMPQERLALGCHKAQDWELIKRRGDMAEIFPLWHRLGLAFKAAVEDGPSLLQECQNTIDRGDRLSIVPAFTNLFHAGFEGMLVPRTVDTEFQGYDLPPAKNAISVLSYGARMIRRCFIEDNNRKVKILPNLPVPFHSGRMLNVVTNIGKVDIEWSKKTIRRMIFHSLVDGEVTFNFQKGLKQYRLRSDKKDRGVSVSCKEDLVVEAEKTYFFDNFLK